MTTTEPTAWTWRTPNDELVEVVPVSWPDEFEWYAEGPGQRPPVFYRLEFASGAVEEIVVHPLDPWSPADAVEDRLVARGWDDLTPVEDPGVCPHGLSAALCEDPVSHYGLD